jgi:hypothetical protein
MKHFLISLSLLFSALAIVTYNLRDERRGAKKKPESRSQRPEAILLGGSGGGERSVYCKIYYIL